MTWAVKNLASRRPPINNTKILGPVRKQLADTMNRQATQAMSGNVAAHAQRISALDKGQLAQSNLRQSPIVTSPSYQQSAITHNPVTYRTGKEFRYAGAFARDSPQILKNTYHRMKSPWYFRGYSGGQFTGVPYSAVDFTPVFGETAGGVLNALKHRLVSSTGIRGLDRPFSAFSKSVKEHRDYWWANN